MFRAASIITTKIEHCSLRPLQLQSLYHRRIVASRISIASWGDAFPPATTLLALCRNQRGGGVFQPPLAAVASSASSFAAMASASSEASAARRPAPQPLAPFPLDGKVKIALCQMSVTEDKERNISHARGLIEKAAADGANLIMLPEMWNCPYSNDSFAEYAEEISAEDLKKSPSAAMMSAVAKDKSVTIVGGSIPESREGRLFNTCCVFGSKGELKGKFSKIHLFDIDIPGQMTFKESLTLSPGCEPLVVDTECGRLGIGICYDIRFQELAMIYAARGVHMICYPGAFNLTTGPLHWELLQRARAVDNQVFVVTCSPARDMKAAYNAWGHSTVVGPFAEILATTGHDEALVFADLNFSELPKRRTNLPLSLQRRGDLYELVDRTKLSP